MASSSPAMKMRVGVERIFMVPILAKGGRGQ